MSRLTDRVAIITGAASGIGRAAALRFAAEGAQVVASDLDEAALAETVRQVVDAGGRAEASPANAGDEEAIASLVETTATRYGRLDAFFANAGVSGEFAPLFDLTQADWEPIIQVNLLGPFWAIKHAGQVMSQAGGGAIVCTASVAGLRSGAGPTPYSATKAGVISLVQTAANQFTGTGVRVNAVCPGLTETGMTKPIFDGARAAGKGDRIGQLNPLQRYAEPVEIANLALFLCSDEASYVNGQAIAADGGLSSSHPIVPGRLA